MSDAPPPPEHPKTQERPRCDLAERQRLACLHAGRVRGLVKYGWGAKTCWYAASSWDRRCPDAALGGPWSVEMVADIAALGWVGIDLDGQKARITKSGRAELRAAQFLANG